MTTFLAIYAIGLALGALVGHLRGSVPLGMFWTMFLGPVGLVLLVLTTGTSRAEA